jgi:5-methylcytosine-specific restriction endonuclease McrA
MVETGQEYAFYLANLHQKREARKNIEKQKGVKRLTLSKDERAQILAKTDSRCHICGGKINGAWDADHVLSHSKGGQHSVENYLPAHKICNNYRWDYLAEEFQEIIKLGVWVRTQVEKETQIGKKIAEMFTKYEIQKIKRRKSKT